MIIVKDLGKLTQYGFVDDGDCFSYDCGDNRTYIVVDKLNGELGISPSYIGDYPATYYDYQLDMIAILLNNSIAYYEYKEVVE